MNERHALRKEWGPHSRSHTSVAKGPKQLRWRRRRRKEARGLRGLAKEMS